MSPSLQAMLLRVLEDGVYCRVGDPHERHSRFGLVCATWRDLPELVRQGRFRQDLFYRIQAVHLTLPPVRERADLPVLARGLLDRIAVESGVRAPPVLSDETLAALARRRWPGNVRELKTALQYAMVLAESGRTIEPQHLPPEPAGVGHSFRATSAGGRRAAEAEATRQALARSGHNLARAARDLGVSRSTLYRMMARHGLTPR
jgi:transcriptional regulator with PAS, ATPase and Fis domain